MTDTVSTRTAQAAARLALRLAGHMIPPGCSIALTETVPGYEPGTSTYAAQPSQVGAAVEQLAAATGRVIPSTAVLAALPWEQAVEDGAA